MIKKTAFFILFFLIVFTGKASGEEIYVQNSTELHKALQQTGSGHQQVIKLAPGEYQGNFIVKNSVHIIGEEGAQITGPDQGSVLTIEADDVIVEGLQIEGGGSQNAGIYIKGNRSYVHHNVFKNVFHGIYAHESYGHRFETNVISSFSDIKKHKGYGIYLAKAPNTVITNNFVHDTQDGVYVSYSDNCQVNGNQMIRARYGVHTMDSRNVMISNNQVRESINGLMIMQSYEISMINNFFYLNTKIDGAGMFVFDTFDSTISSNIVMNNSKGLLLENAKRNQIEFNMFFGNNIGLEIRQGSENNIIYLNNFYKNTNQIISAKDNQNQFSRDQYGNFFDDHRSLNINQDDTVDYAYKSGDVFYNMSSNEPYLQIFYKSPAVELWNMIERYTPIPSDTFIIDEFPLAQPAPFQWGNSTNNSPEMKSKDFSSIQILFFLLVFGASILIIWSARSEKHEA